MGKSHVKVYVRSRPTANAFEGFKILPDNASVAIHLPKNEAAGLINNQPDQFNFKFDGILENVSQETVYSTCVHDAVEYSLSGFNTALLVYGQTGAGKTFTMSGDLRNYHHRGVIPRVLNHVFKHIEVKVDKFYKVHVSYLEIYNECMYDLLSDTPESAGNLAIMEDHNQTHVKGLTQVEVSSEEEALAQFFAGEQGRSVSSHSLNSTSSRSHCIFTVHLEIRHSADANERAVLSKIHLVDLAGSERTKKTNATGQLLKEANFINKSLTFLEATVNALSNKDSHVPYRQSKLTSLLRDALGGNSRTILLANVWCEGRHMEETISTLRFASRVRTLVTDCVVNESNDPALLIKKLERQIRELKQELAMRDVLSGRSRTSYEDMSEAEVADLAALARRFLAGEAGLEDLPIDSIKHIHATYQQLQLGFQSMKADLTSQMKRLSQRALPDTDVLLASFNDGAGVGEEDPSSRGFHVGQAPELAKPETIFKGGASSPQSRGDGDRGVDSRLEAAGPRSTAAAGGTVAQPQDWRQTPDDDAGGDASELFRAFKTQHPRGVQLSGSLKELQQQLKQQRQQEKTAAQAVNSIKHRIDDTAQHLALRSKGKAGMPGSNDVIDQEHYSLLQELKLLKQQYRTDMDALKTARTECESLMLQVAGVRRELLQEFEHHSNIRLGASSVGGQAGRAAGSGAAGSGGDDDEELDAGEAFERMEMQRIMATDPDSGAYHAARKKVVRRGGGGRAQVARARQ